MTTSLQEIREEFRKNFGRYYYSETVGMDWEKPEKIGTKTGKICLPSDEIEDFWLAKYESLIKERDAEMVKRIEGMDNHTCVYRNKNDDFVSKSKVLLLLTTTPTEGGE